MKLTNNEVRASLDLEVYGDADPAVTAQQASQAAIAVLQQDFDTRPSGGLKTQVRQVGKPTPGGKPAPVVTDEAAPPYEAEGEEAPATEPLAAETDAETPAAEPVASQPDEPPATETVAVESTSEVAAEEPPSTKARTRRASPSS